MIWSFAKIDKNFHYINNLEEHYKYSINLILFILVYLLNLLSYKLDYK